MQQLALRIDVVMGGTPLGAPRVGWVVDRFGARWAQGIGALFGIAAAAVAVICLITYRNLHLSRDGARLRFVIHPDPTEAKTVGRAAGERVK